MYACVANGFNPLSVNPLIKQITHGYTAFFKNCLKNNKPNSMNQI